MEQITITIDKNGSVKLETAGFKGASCKEATANIERALGQVTSDTPTQEANEVQGVRSVNRG